MRIFTLYFVWSFFILTVPLPVTVHATGPALYKVSQENYPLFQDNETQRSFYQAAEKQLSWLQKQPPGTILSFGEANFFPADIQLSIEIFLQYLKTRPSLNQLNSFLQENYDVYQAGGRRHKPKGEMLVTGYYEPTFHGNIVKTRWARWPIYRPPPRKAGNKTARWPTRAEIEDNNLFAGEELVWLNDPFEAYLLHIQGSGKILFPDGTVRAVRYAGSNNYPYRSLGKLFVDRKIMPLEKVNNVTIDQWFKNHPDKQREMLQRNPRFIFFEWGNTENPHGANGVQLTPRRSIAIDPSVLPTGGIAFLKSRKPLFNKRGELRGWRPLHRFVFPQDQGAAIKGPGRVDIFWGSDNYAKNAANLMKEPGKLYFLLLKETSVSREKRSQ